MKDVPGNSIGGFGLRASRTYSTITPRTVSDQNESGASPSRSVSTLELLVLVHHIEEPLVGFSGRERAVGRRQSERHLGRRHVRVGVLVADAEAGSVGHAFKLGRMIGRCDGCVGQPKAPNAAGTLGAFGDISSGYCPSRPFPTSSLVVFRHHHRHHRPRRHRPRHRTQARAWRATARWRGC